MSIYMKSSNEAKEEEEAMKEGCWRIAYCRVEEASVGMLVDVYDDHRVHVCLLCRCLEGRLS